MSKQSGSSLEFQIRMCKTIYWAHFVVDCMYHFCQMVSQGYLGCEAPDFAVFFAASEMEADGGCVFHQRSFPPNLMGGQKYCRVLKHQDSDRG